MTDARPPLQLQIEYGIMDPTLAFGAVLIGDNMDYWWKVEARFASRYVSTAEGYNLRSSVRISVLYLTIRPMALQTFQLG